MYMSKTQETTRKNLHKVLYLERWCALIIVDVLQIMGQKVWIVVEVGRAELSLIKKRT